jgi:hypothetical protein
VLGSLGPGAKGLSLKLVSTTELRVSPGRAELGLTLRLVNAVWGRGHSGRRAHKGGYTHTNAQHMHIDRIHTIKAGYKEDTGGYKYTDQILHRDWERSLAY